MHPSLDPDSPLSDPARRLAGRAVAALAVGTLLLGAAAPTVLAAGRAPQPTGGTTVAQAAGDNETVIAVAASASPAVVTIRVADGSEEVELEGPFGPFPGDGFVRGVGSGVVIDPSGLVLTNRHVVDGAETVTVLFADGDEREGEVVGVDTYTDFALVRVEGEGLPAVELGDSSALRVGQLAVAIGSPLGRFPGTVSSGIVSGLDRTLQLFDPSGGGRLRHLIQTDAAINPGNSGGALLDGDGRLIGINTAVAGGAQGIGFALPIDIAKPIIAQVQAGEEIARPWMGVVFQDIDAQVAQDEGLEVTSGALIRSSEDGGEAVVEDSPADQAGIVEDDILVAIDGQTIDREHPLDLLLLTFAPGQTITVTVLRDGAEQDLELTLGTRPSDLGR